MWKVAGEFAGSFCEHGAFALVRGLAGCRSVARDRSSSRRFRLTSRRAILKLMGDVPARSHPATRLLLPAASELQKCRRISCRSGGLLARSSGTWRRGCEARQRRNRLVGLGVPNVTEIQPETIAEFAVIGEHRPWRNADMFGQRAPVQAESIRRTPRHVDPYEIAPVRSREAGAGWEMARHRLDHRLLSRHQGLPQATQMTVIAALLEIVGHSGLH
jgi:hypothetical protein